MEKRYLDYFTSNIKALRVGLGFKQENLAKSSGVSISYISRMETLGMETNDETLAKIYHQLNHDLIINDKTIEDMDKQLESFHYCMVVSNIAEAKKMFVKLSHEKEKYLYSVELIKFCLFMYQYINMIGDEKNVLIDLNSYLDKLKKLIFFNNWELQLLYDCKGVYEEDRTRFEAANDYYTKAISYGNFSNITSMVYYHQSKTLYYLSQTIESFLANNKALELFKEENNIVRIYYTQSHNALLYTKFKSFKRAKEIEYSLLNMSGMEQYKSITLRNLSWCLIKSGEYKSAIHTLLKDNGIKHFTATSFFYVSWSYYCLNNYQKALHYAKLGLLKPIDDNVVHEQLQTIIDLIEIKDKSIVQVLLDRYSRLENCMINDDREIFIQFIIDNAEKYHMLKIANSFYKALIK